MKTTQYELTCITCEKQERAELGKLERENLQVAIISEGSKHESQANVCKYIILLSQEKWERK